MHFSDTDEVPGYVITARLGDVTGKAVHLNREDAKDDARKQLLQRLQSRSADGIIKLRYMFAGCAVVVDRRKPIAKPGFMCLAIGNAVKLQEKR